MVGPIWLQVPRAGSCTARIKACSNAKPAHAENNVELINTLTRSGEAKGRRETDVGTTRLGLPLNDYSEIGLQPRSMPTTTNSCVRASLFGGRALHLAYHRAPPWLVSVTESIALPPRPKKAVNMSNISRSSVREWLVPPVLLPILFVLLIAATVLIRW